jgi:hypothetical protein
MEEENKMTIAKDLQAISKELTKLVKQTENFVSRQSMNAGEETQQPVKI